MKRILLLICALSNCYIAYNQIIKGTILDKANGDKIAGASVYFNGTFAGTITDKNGNFRLDISKNTSMPLSISALGYYSATLNSYSTTDSIFIQLARKTFNLNEVVIRDKSLVKERKKNIRIFKDVFLGMTSNASSCKIINENDITFNYKTDKDTLIAFASKPLQIENRALGYNITYFLDDFEYDRNNGTLSFKGNIIFNDIKFSEVIHNQSYEQQRIKAYKGSKMHFFRELWADNLKAAGFTILDSAGNEMDYAKIVIEEKDHKKYLAPLRNLTINYKPPDEEKKTDDYYYKRSLLTSKPQEEISSIIIVQNNRVPFDSTGYFDGSEIYWKGQMATQRLADVLPFEYSVSNISPLPIVSGNSQTKDSTLSDESPATSDSPKLIEKVYLHTDRTYYYPGDDIWFKAYLIDAYYNKLSGNSWNLHVELISPAQDIISSTIIRLEGGLGNGDFKLSKTLTAGKYRIRAYTNYMCNYSDQIFFNKEIKIIKTSASVQKSTIAGKNQQSKIGIDFFPEGGSLVENVTSVVAFKAVDADGKGCDVTGTVYSSSGEMITIFQSTHLGMGSFELKPVPGLSYYAIVKSFDNAEVRSGLPKSFSSGVTLNASTLNDKELSVIVRTNDETLSHVKDKDLKLSVTVRKEVVKTIFLRIRSLSNNLKLPVDDLPHGIIMLTLSTAEDLPLAERLIYIQPEQEPRIIIQPDKAEYKKRDPVSVTLSISGDSTNQETAFLSFAAAEGDFTDKLGEYPTTIASWFLLESDVHGTVEGPSYYFDPSNPGRFKDLDLLLLTQGWRDFSWKSDPTQYFSPETGFFISGRIRKLNRDKPLSGSKIQFTVFQGDNLTSKTVPADSSGRFYLNKIDITGNARLVISAVDKNGSPNGILLLDSMKYVPAKISDYLPSPTVVRKEESLTINKDDEIEAKEKKLAQEYDTKETIRKKYKLSDTIEIGEVVITAPKQRDIQVEKIESVRSMYGGQPDDEVIVTPSMENFSSAPELLLGTVAGVIVTGTPGSYKVRFHRAMAFGGMSKVEPLLVVDGIKHDLNYLNFLPVSIIDRIDILKNAGKTAVYGLDGANGVISVITRSGNRTTKEPVQVKHTVNTTFSGYDSPRVFYSPHHDGANQHDSPDLRTTIFWKPDISLQQGKELLLKYYNADNNSAIRIIVEGITSTGIPVTSMSEYEIR